MAIHPRFRTRRIMGAFFVSVFLATSWLTFIPPAQARPVRCADVDLMITRGTYEKGPYGNVVGDALAAHMVEKLAGRKTMSIYAVHYPASIFPGSADQGQHDLVRHAVEKAAACPKQEFVISGYSQGALVVDMAIGIVHEDGEPVTDPATILPAAVGDHIKAILLFGNPLHLVDEVTTGVYAPRVLDTCRDGDPACDLGGTNVDAHTEYGADTDAAAAWAVARLLPPPAPSPSPAPGSLVP